MAEAQAAFLNKVKDLLSTTEEFTAGGIRMLNLEALEREAGDRWPAVQSRLADTARRVLDRYLSQNDSYIQLSDSAIVIVFSDYSGDAAKIRVAEISREIRERVLADAAIPDFDLMMLNESTAVSASADAAAGGMAAFADFLSRHQRLEVQMQSEEPFSACANADLRYHSLWDRRVEASFKLVLDIRPGSLPRRLRALRGHAEHAADRRAQAVIDCAVLRMAVEALRKQATAEKAAGSIIAPVICATSFSTDSLQNLILPYLRAIPDDARASFIPILKESRLGSLAADLRGKPALLKHFARDVGLITNLEDRNLSAALGEGFGMIGVDAREYAGTPAARLKEPLKLFADQARRCRARSFLLGVDGSETLRMGMAAGINLLAGERISRPSRAPSPPRRMPAADVAPGVPSPPAAAA